jgi:hypothetical protein
MKRWIVVSLFLGALGASALAVASRSAPAAADDPCPCHCPTCPLKGSARR